MNRQSLLAWLTILATISAFFGPAVVNGRPLLFRDSAHFYYPLFEWCCREWSAGRVPLWNPYENCGSPVLADATSSVLYPGKLLFALPLSYDTCFNLYIASHVVLAAANCYAAARAWRASPAAAALAAIGYSCGGAVVFQYCNIVFLVGAAWLPLALLCADRMLRRTNWTAAISLGVVLALMVLGGDPQAAYHSLLACGLYAAVLGWRKKSSTAPPQRGFWLQRLGLCALTASVAFCLSAAQILPSMEATSRSDRAAFSRPRNIYEAVAVAWQSSSDDERPSETRSQSIFHGLLGEPETYTHHEATYEFSVGPWRLAEFIWPNIGGRLFPTNRRWFSLLPGEGRVWTPTLYLGLLPALLAIGSLCGASQNHRETWLKWLFALAIIGSLGYYGVGWLLHELTGAIGTHSKWTDSIGNPVGGLYWLLTTFLPGYVYFRYPAKLLPLATLAICLLAAKRFDHAFSRRENWLVSSLAFLAGVSGLAAVAVWFAGNRYFADVTTSDSTLGPFDATATRHDIRFALLHTAVIGFVLWMAVRCFARYPNRVGQWKWIVVLLTAADIWAANAWTIVSIAPNVPRTLSSLTSHIRKEHASSTSDTSPTRVFRGNLATWRPPSFRLAKSNNRLTELTQWERQTLLPKYPLLDGISLVETHGSIASADYQALFYVAKQHGPRQRDKSLTPQPTALRLLATEFLILPESHQVEFASRVEHANSNWPESAALWQMNRTLPRCWLVPNVETLPELKRPLRMPAIQERARNVLFPEGKTRDFSHSAVVETDDPQKEWASNNHQSDREICQIVHDSPQRVVIAANPKQPSLLVLADAFYPGWTATVTTDGKSIPTSIYRTNRVLRGVWLSAGQQTIEFRYQPRSFYGGAIISSISWLALAIFGASRLVRRQKPTIQIE
ncbi:MAG TPA: hypothetical protein VGI40_05245 [Pirellulaceae bacterium]